MNFWEALLLGVLQGLTEFLPISSSGHLKALREVLGFQEIGITFDVMLHLATLLAVIIYFRRDLLDIVRGPRLWPLTLRLGLATAPIFLVGYLAESALEQLSIWAVVFCWGFSGVYLLTARGRHGTLRYGDMSLRSALVIGLVQCLAILPGVSRSGSTITAGLWLGLDRTEAARFSFFLAIPAILGAAGYKGFKLVRDGGLESQLNAPVLVGMAASFVVGLFAIHFLLRIVRGSGFHRFAWYNFAAAVALALYLLLRG
jgi:undecaprenyl-diphosphatase